MKNPKKRATMREAWQAIGLVIFVVLFNYALYILIQYLPSQFPMLAGSHFFPAMILFLSFAISVGIILIIALGEKIDASKIENPWVKKIGVTPIMIIVAVLVSLMAAWTPLGKLIIPDSSALKFMLADIGVTCVTKEENGSPQATHLLTVIAADENYIQEVGKFLDNANLKTKSKRKAVDLVKPNDEIYKLLYRYAQSRQRGSESLDLRNDDRWIAYTVDVRAPTTSTFIPVPTVYDKNQSTRLFAVVADRPSGRDPEAGLPPTLTAGAIRKSIVPLLQIEILPQRPSENWQHTQVGVEMFADHICWQIGG